MTTQDIFDFQSAWFAGTFRADFNASGAISTQDLFDFLAAWFAGCGTTATAQTINPPVATTPNPAHPQLTAWDLGSPVNKAETRQFMSQVWQAEDAGQEFDVSTFVFTNSIPDIMTVLVAPQHELFSRLYAHRLDPLGILGQPYGLDDLMKEGLSVRNQFRHCVLTDEVVIDPATDPSADMKALRNHRLLVMDSACGCPLADARVSSYTLVGGVGGVLTSAGLTMCTKVVTTTPPASVPGNDPFDCDLQWWVQRSFFSCMREYGLYTQDCYCDPNNPNTQLKPGFDCDDFTDAMIEWLKHTLDKLYPTGYYKV